MTEVSIEAVPVAVGVLIGFGTWRLISPRFRAVVLLVISLLAGLAITYLSGELRLSWAFVVFDVGQVLLTAVVTITIASHRSQRARSHVAELRGLER
jgi:hypothetical protein